MKYLICNLKANKNYEEMFAYKEIFNNIKNEKVEIIFAPSAIYLPIFKNCPVKLCVQDINLNENLNLTGDISIKQLKSLDVKYAIIGHFERKKYYKESEFDILSKIKNAIKNNIKVIYCIGESLEERNRRVEYQVLERQLARIFNKLSNEELKNIIIAYEPTDLIGNNFPYDILKIKSMITFIKKLIRDYYNIELDIIFGGNVNSENIDDLIKLKDLDGFIICSAILNPENIPKIANKMTTT